MLFRTTPGVFSPGRYGKGQGVWQRLNHRLKIQRLLVPGKIRLTGAVLLFTLHVFSQAPDFIWAKGIGGTGSEYSTSIAIDASGNTYTTGVFSGTVDFDPGAGVFNLTAVGSGWDMFVLKLDNSGNFLWAAAFEGTEIYGGDWSGAIAIDAAGDVYVAGSIGGTTDFDPGPAVYNLTLTGSNDIFLVKLNGSGNFIWAKLMYGIWSSTVLDMVIDPATGSVYFTGGFEISVDFNPGSGVFYLSTAGGEDAYISKLDNNGNFVWAKRFGGTWHETGISITLDQSGNVYSTGTFQNTADFDPGPGVFNLSAVPNTDVFKADVYISKLSSSGSFVWAKGFIGTGNSSSSSVVVDASGNVFISGFFSGTVDFNPGAGVYPVTSSGNDGFLCKLDGSGNFVWVKTFGGTGPDGIRAMSLDGAGNIFTSGTFSGTADLDPNPAAVFNFTSQGSVDVYVAKLDNSGNLLWAKTAGGTSPDVSYSLVLDAFNCVHVTGVFHSAAPVFGSVTLVNQGSVIVSDAFVAKLDMATGNPLPVELSYFSATAISAHRVELQWTTLTEINNDYFVVQKSMDGRQFEDVIRIPGAGNSSTPNNYSCFDDDPFQTPVSYYRLGQVDYDGRIHYSEKVAVAFVRDDFEILSAYAEPANQSMRIYFASHTAGRLDYFLYDVMGKTLLHKKITSEKGVNLITIDGSNFSPGIYYFSIGNDRDVLKTKVFYTR